MSRPRKIRCAVALQITSRYVIKAAVKTANGMNHSWVFSAAHSGNISSLYIDFKRFMLNHGIQLLVLSNQYQERDLKSFIRRMNNHIKKLEQERYDWQPQLPRIIRLAWQPKSIEIMNQHTPDSLPLPTSILEAYTRLIAPTKPLKRLTEDEKKKEEYKRCNKRRKR